MGSLPLLAQLCELPMSEPPKDEQKSEVKKPPFDLRSLLHPRRKSEHQSFFDEFVSSNENNPTKSRIPDPAGMAVYQTLGLWGSTSKTFTVEVGGKSRTFPRTVAGLHQVFKMWYD